MIDANVNVFFALARERYAIQRRREGTIPNPHAPHFSANPIFQRYRFCNLFREQDRTTAWFRDTLREPLRNDAARVLFATIAFRWFNRISTGKLISGFLMEGHRTWKPESIRTILKDVKPVVTGAYIIKTPNGMNKLDGVLWCIEQVRKDIDHLAGALGHTPPDERSLEGTWEALRQFPYLGDFMSYEVVTDLRHTCWLDQASDRYTWCNPGPGCTRGLGWVVHGDFDRWNRSSKTDRAAMQPHLEKLLELANSDSELWPDDFPDWEMREVEHWLCEVCKYVRVESGGSPPKEIFRNALASVK
jgi:hypothetical protein